MSFLRKNALALVPVIAALLPVASYSQTRDVKIYGFGAKSGVVRIFGQICLAFAEGFQE